MAHHNSTPRSILDAPTRTEVVTDQPIYATRAERRRGATAIELNVPAVRTTPRRGRNVRRHAVTR